MPQRHLQVQLLALRPAPLDQRHLPDLRVHLVRRVVSPRRLDERLPRQPLQIRRLPLHQEAAIRHLPHHPPVPPQLLRDPVVPLGLQLGLVHLDDVHPVVQRPLPVAASARPLRLELRRQAIQQLSGLLQIEKPGPRGDQTPRVPRRVRLVVTPERRQSFRSVLRVLTGMHPEPAGVQPLVHGCRWILHFGLATTAPRPVECGRHERQQRKHQNRDENSTDPVTESTAIHQNLPECEEAPGRTVRRQFKSEVA